MKKIVIVLAAAVVSFSTASAFAGGFGGSRGNANNSAGGLINVAPGIALGDVNLLNGISVLNGSPILSGNNTQVGNGLLNGIGVGVLGVGTGVGNAASGILGGGNHYKLGRH